MEDNEKPLHAVRMGLETNLNGGGYKHRKGLSNKKRLEIAMALNSTHLIT